MSMAISSSSSIIIIHNSTGFSSKPSCMRVPPLSWNPISRLAVSCAKKSDLSCFWGTKTSLQYSHHDSRKSFILCANSGADQVPPPPPPSFFSKYKGWIIGMMATFILPFFTNNWGPLRVLRNKVENAVQRVEDIVEAVEKVAENVDRIAEDIADDLPQGSKLRDLVEQVEQLAEKTAKTADTLDDVIDKVQETGEHMDEIIESAILARQAQDGKAKTMTKQ